MDQYKNGYFQTNVENGDRRRERRGRGRHSAADEKGRARMLENRGNAHWQEALQYYAKTGEDIDSPKLFEKPIEKLNAKVVHEVAKKFFGSATLSDIVIRSK